MRSLCPLGLEGEPATELMGPLVATWAADLWAERQWDQTKHRGRIADAFAELRKTSERWPGMVHFRAAWKLSEPQQPARQDFTGAGLEWHRNKPGNRSLIARAHARHCSVLLGLPIPAWALGDATVSEASILAEIERIRGSAENSMRMRSDLARLRGNPGADRAAA